LSLPREIGTDPGTGKTVRAGLGIYGPYVECNRVFASVPTVDVLFTITLPEALERIRNKHKRPVLRELGDHPETGAKLQILKGRYGPYVTDGKVNATIGKDRDPEEVELAEAVALLKEAATRKGTGGKRGRGKTTAKKTAKKTTKKTGRKPAKKAGKKTAKKPASSSAKSSRKSERPGARRGDPQAAEGDG